MVFVPNEIRHRMISPYRFLILVLKSLSVFAEDTQKLCYIPTLFVCSENETCAQLTTNSTQGVCKCIKNFTVDEQGNCVPLDYKAQNVFATGPSASAIAIGLILPVIAIALAGVLYFAARRYKWLHRFSSQSHQLRMRNTDQLGLVIQDDILH